ncbi:MAG: cellulose synthase/poly-beta-1,6-N-acetylglucosamine synthase-like glycosyltransferase [Bradymonadia bacterium]|jgi:cellulose synthase/poly-beta-1,6-N-acetylglucosamine synthase-like glycosyltransferase
MEAVVRLVDFIFLLFFLTLNIGYTVLMMLSMVEILLRNVRRIDTELHHSLGSFYTIPVTIIAPAYNESMTIEASIKALLSLRYPEFEVIVVNDGSKDDTVGTMIEAFDLYPVHPIYRMRIPTKEIRGIYKSRTEPRLTFIDKENGGKADALNCGVNAAEYPLFCGIDADTLILPDALLKVCLPFMEQPEKTVASGGTIRVANGCTVRGGQVEKVGFPKNAVARFQVVEYLRAFLFGRVGWNIIDGTLIISGAFGVFKRQTAIEVGGYTHDTVGEDMELVVKMHRYLREHERDYRIVFVWDAACYTEVPESLDVLSRQRNRWHRGLMDSLFRHRVMMGNPKYGVIGTVVFPFFGLFEMLGPLIELTGVAFVCFSFLFGVVDGAFMCLFLTVSVLFGIMLSILAVLLEEISYAAFPSWRDLLMISAYAVLENFGYRQLTVLWRVRGMWAFIRGQKQWGAMVRKGFAPKEEI